MRQTPNYSGQWGDYQFFLNDEIEECDYLVVFEEFLKDPVTAICSPDNTIFVAAEYSAKAYGDSFLRQFNYVLTSQTEVKHPRLINTVVGQPWFVGKSYDELRAITEVKKSKKISIVASSKYSLPGHRKRFDFVRALKDYFGDAVDFFGRGIRPFDDKWDVLAPYQYSIAIENAVGNYYLTEKLFDCYLAYTVPLYYGAPYAEHFFPKESMLRIDIDDLENSKRIIKGILNSDDHYRQRFEYLVEAKEKCLEQYQLFPIIVNLIESKGLSAAAPKSQLTIQRNVAPDTFTTLKSLPNRAAYKLRLMLRSLKHKVRKPRPPQENRYTSWFRDDGDNTLRVNYDLNHESTVLDVGGYKGLWSSDISLRYSPKIHIFEPHTDYADQISQRFGENRQITVHRFGIGPKTEKLTLSITGDTSSLFKSGEDEKEVQLMCAADFFDEYQIEDVDLVKINIEGGEYDLLEYLLKEGLITKFRDIQVQFHDFIPDAKTRMNNIQEQLRRTHEVTYQYEFVWENWRRKAPA